MINVTLTRKELETLLKSTKPNSMKLCVMLERKGLMKFTGNQHNPNWDFETLKEVCPSDEELYQFYLDVRDDD